ncbi:response regulator transcription factor [Kitasatospora sp. NPDC048722]|uniref:response regulator transcription factor n=1 Tax=Kitasatospora sp. NPDC048722 TaxID=3155639 RepID=UPI0033F61FEB
MRVLVVEDESRMAEALRDGLRAEGYTVDVVNDGRSGLWYARLNDYRVIVLDVMLPGLNGYRVCARLRQEGVTTPILMLTAKDGEYDEIEALDTGADDYLAKPFSYPVLVARLRALVRRGGAGRRPELTAGDLVLDPADHSCRRAGTPVELTPREFAVLECLAERPGEVVAKTAILDQVWENGFEGDPNIVEVYISALRRKIDTPFGRSSIVTVRGSGYRLDARG